MQILVSQDLVFQHGQDLIVHALSVVYLYIWVYLDVSCL